MKICYSRQMRKLDETSINEFGIPGVVLMENAAAAVVREIEGLKLFDRRAAVFCGTGNNGGDGFAIARLLHNKGWQVDVLLCGDEGKIKGDALVNYRIIKKLNLPIHLIGDSQIGAAAILAGKSALIVDALLGTGFKGELSGLYKKIIGIMNDSQSFIVSVDIPSGLDSDTGFFAGDCIRADMTVTFQLPKLGLVVNDGPEACGRLIAADISIPGEAIEEAGLQISLTDLGIVKGVLKKRSYNTHKGTYGRVLVVAGSKGMVGAGVMASKAVLRSGAGTVVLAVPESIQSAVNAHVVELMTKGLSDNQKGYLQEACIPQIHEASAESDCLLVGSGLTVEADVRKVVFELVRSSDVPLVIDADGLNALAYDLDVLKEKKADIVITPHPGEMARLMRCSTIDVQRNRLESARKLAAQYGIVVVLKGFRTVVALPDGSIYINPTGNPGMATAGSGDVLAGVIAGFAAQGYKASDAAICGVYVHGAAGDAAAEKNGEYGLTAGDIIENVTHTIKNITGK